MNIVILGSGKGSNAEAVLRAEREGNLGLARVAALFSDRLDAGILELGERFGVEARYLDPGGYRTKLSEAAESAYIEAVGDKEPGLVVLAGFMRVIKAPFISAFPGKIINLHPSLLPSFRGLDAIGQAFRAGVKITGCTVHYVSEAVDAGPIIDQEPVRIENNDTEETLAEKVHEAEHCLLPRVIARLSEREGDRS